jgi:transposase-like protein
MSETITQRRRRSREEADRLVSEYEQSGLTRMQFCIQHGISKATLDNYRKRKAVSPRRASMAIVPVELTDGAPSNGASLWLELVNGRRIEVGHGFDAATLERLIAVADAV